MVTKIIISEIDKINVLQASLLAMKNSLEDLLSLNSNALLENKEICYALIDGNKCPNKLPIISKPVVRGDALVYPIALASIVAKVERDHIMVCKIPFICFWEHNYTIFCLNHPFNKHFYYLLHNTVCIG